MKINVKSFLFSLAVLSAGFMVSCGSDNASSDAADTTENMQDATPTASNESGAPLSSLADAAAETVPSGPTTTISFDKGLVYEYGTITAGEKVSYSFKFTNTGTEPLVISNCKGSCGCTVPVCPTSPIPPGGKGEIPVEFDSKGKNGPDTKTVTITANTNPATTVLTLRGDVKGTPVAN